MTQKYCRIAENAKIRGLKRENAVGKRGNAFLRYVVQLFSEIKFFLHGNPPPCLAAIFRGYLYYQTRRYYTIKKEKVNRAVHEKIKKAKRLNKLSVLPIFKISELF